MYDYDKLNWNEYEYENINLAHFLIDPRDKIATVYDDGATAHDKEKSQLERLLRNKREIYVIFVNFPAENGV